MSQLILQQTRMARYASSRYQRSRKRFYKRKYKRTRKYGSVKRAYRPYGAPKRNMAVRANISKTVVSFPDVMHTRLNYIDTKCGYSSLAPTANRPYTANSVYDPFSAAGGDSALVLTQYAAIYRKYRVTAASISVELNNSMTLPIFAGVTASSTQFSFSTISGTAFGAGLQGVTKRVMLAKNGTPGSVKRLYLYCPMSKIAGTDINSENDYASLVNTDPYSKLYFNLWMASFDGTSALSAGVIMDCKIVYYVTFFDRKNGLELALGPAPP